MSCFVDTDIGRDSNGLGSLDGSFCSFGGGVGICGCSFIGGLGVGTAGAAGVSLKLGISMQS